METKIKHALPYIGLVLCLVVSIVFCAKVYSILTEKPREYIAPAVQQQKQQPEEPDDWIIWGNPYENTAPPYVREVRRTAR